MVDARDLKSLGRKPLCRFESGRPHQNLEAALRAIPPTDWLTSCVLIFLPSSFDMETVQYPVKDRR